MDEKALWTQPLPTSLAPAHPFSCCAGATSFRGVLWFFWLCYLLARFLGPHTLFPVPRTSQIPYQFFLCQPVCHAEAKMTFLTCKSGHFLALLHLLPILIVKPWGWGLVCKGFCEPASPGPCPPPSSLFLQLHTLAHTII